MIGANKKTKEEVLNDIKTSMEKSSKDDYMLLSTEDILKIKVKNLEKIVAQLIEIL
ncbi:MAG: hypothetical protein RLZZ546_1076 [Bacteroidota bacterium]|jgi:hypothetical protein